MYKLLEDYLNEVLFISKPKVKFFNEQKGTICIYTWIGEYDNDYTKSEVDIWLLLDFTYSKISN